MLLSLIYDNLGIQVYDFLNLISQHFLNMSGDLKLYSGKMDILGTKCDTVCFSRLHLQYFEE